MIGLRTPGRSRKDHVICRYCGQQFQPSPYRPDQQVCSAQECQRRRRNEYHRRKLNEDPLYREQCLDSQKKWRANNPDYLKSYRVERERSRLLKELHRLTDLVKNNVVFDLRSSDISLWIVGPKDLLGEKNNLACAEVIVLQAIARVAVRKGSEKNISL
jgi:hypothetical protein